MVLWVSLFIACAHKYNSIDHNFGGMNSVQAAHCFAENSPARKGEKNQTAGSSVSDRVFVNKQASTHESPLIVRELHGNRSMCSVEKSYWVRMAEHTP